jgi:hypothetical protein
VTGQKRAGRRRSCLRRKRAAPSGIDQIEHIVVGDLCFGDPHELAVPAFDPRGSAGWSDVEAIAVQRDVDDGSDPETEPVS